MPGSDVHDWTGRQLRAKAELQLGPTGDSGIYDRFNRLPEIRSALAAWATYVERLVTGENKHGEVVVFETASIDSRLASGTRAPMARPVA